MKNKEYSHFSYLNFKLSPTKLLRALFSLSYVAHIFFAVFLVSCISKQPAHTQTQGLTEITKPLKNPTKTLAKSYWNVTYLALDGEKLLPTNRTPTLLINANGSISGTTGCNRYFASIKQENNHFKIKDIGTTRMACKGALMKQENLFLKSLELVAFFEQQNEILLLGRENRSLIIKLRSASAASNSALAPIAHTIP